MLDYQPVSQSRVLVLRHGQSVWNAEGRWQGLADPPLSELGSQQAAAAVPFLIPHGFIKVLSSDLVRAANTADIIAKGLGIQSVEYDKRLRERDAGEWTGLTNEEIAKKWPDLAAKRAAGEYVSPVGALNENFEKTVTEVLHDLCDASSDGPLLVISHGGLIRTLERVITGHSSERVTNLSGRWYKKVDAELFADGKFDIADMTETSPEDVL